MKKVFTITLCLVFFVLGVQFASNKNATPSVEKTVDKQSAYTQNDNTPTESVTNDTNKAEETPGNVESPKDEQNKPSIQVNNNIEPTIQKPTDDIVVNNNDNSNTINKKDIEPSQPIVEQPSTNIDSTQQKDNFSIGNISLNSTNADVMRLYGQYLHDSTDNTKYFVGGPGQYGDFLLTIESGNNTIKRITYLQNNLTNPILTMNFNSIKIGSPLTTIINTYGKSTSDVTSYDVRTLTYTNISSTSNVTFYIDKNKNIVYGFEIVRK